MVWVYPDNLRAAIYSAPTLRVTSALRNDGWRVDLLIGDKVARATATDIGGVEVIGFPRSNTFLVKQIAYHLPVLRYVLHEWDRIDVIFFMPMSLPWMLILRTAGLLGHRADLSRFLFRALQPRTGPIFVMDTRTMPMSRSTPRDYLRGLYTDAMNHLANHFADGQTTITTGMAEVYRVPSSKLLGTWPSGVDVALFSPSAHNRTWPRPDERVEICYLGYLAPGRNLMHLSEAVCLANREGMRFRLTLVGDGPDHDRLAAFAMTSNGDVRVVDCVPHDQVPAMLSEMHVGALPFPNEPEFQVSSPIKLFEYLAAGMPVLATRIACHTDVLGDVDCAFWAEDSSPQSLLAALRGLWGGRRSLSEGGRAAAELAEGYSWSASAQCLAKALERGLARHGK